MEDRHNDPFLLNENYILDSMLWKELPLLLNQNSTLLDFLLVKVESFWVIYEFLFEMHLWNTTTFVANKDTWGGIGKLNDRNLVLLVARGGYLDIARGFKFFRMGRQIDAKKSIIFVEDHNIRNPVVEVEMGDLSVSACW